METHIWIFATTGLIIPFVTGSSSFKLATTLIEVENFEFDCLNFDQDSEKLVSCSAMCYDPKSPLWNNLYQRLIYQENISGEEVKCLYFQYNVASKSCSLCLTYDSVPSSVHSITEVEDITVGIQLPVVCPPGWYAWRTSCYKRIYGSTNKNGIAGACSAQNSKAIPAELTTVEEFETVLPHLGGGSLWISGSDQNSDNHLIWTYSQTPILDELFGDSGPDHSRGNYVWLSANIPKLDLWSNVGQGWHYVCEIDHITY